MSLSKMWDGALVQSKECGTPNSSTYGQAGVTSTLIAHRQCFTLMFQQPSTKTHDRASLTVLLTGVKANLQDAT